MGGRGRRKGEGPLYYEVRAGLDGLGSDVAFWAQPPHPDPPSAAGRLAVREGLDLPLEAGRRARML